MATLLKPTLITIFIITIQLVKGFNSEADEQQQPCGSVDGLAVLLGCQNFLLKDGPKVPPSGDCCKAVEEIGMNCTCKIITKDIEAILSMEKLVFVAQSCGQPLAPGTQCGSKTSNNSL